MENTTNLDSMGLRVFLGGTGVLNETEALNFASNMQKYAAVAGQKELDEKLVPIPFKALLSLEEASKLTGIGQNKLRELSNEDNCPFVLWNGNKRMFKREKLISFLYSSFSI